MLKHSIFDADGRIIVEKGAMLVIKNSILTSRFDNGAANNGTLGYWQGILVSGDPNAFQDAGQMTLYTMQRYTARTQFGAPKHGMLLLGGIPSQNSNTKTQIRLARDGVRVFDGGYVYAKNSDFWNNINRDIFFFTAPHGNIQNSIIEDCSFTHSNYFQVENGNPLGVRHLLFNPKKVPNPIAYQNCIISIHLCPNIQLVNAIKNSLFENSCAVNANAIRACYIIGVYNNGSIVTVNNGCTFRKLFNGILSQRDLISPTQTYMTVNNSHFFDCFSGIWNKDVDFFLATLNDFALPRNYGNVGSFGIWVETTTDYAIGDNNTFTISTNNIFGSGNIQNARNAGVAVWASNILSGNIHCNQFTGIRTNVYSRNDNTNALVLSNSFNTTLNNDIFAEKDPQTTGGLFLNQWQSPTRSAGNDFCNTNNANTFMNIRLDAGVNKMNYYFDGALSFGNRRWPAKVTPNLVFRKQATLAGSCTMVDDEPMGGVKDDYSDSMAFHLVGNVNYWFAKADSIAQGGVDSTEYGFWSVCRLNGDHYLAASVRNWNIKYGIIKNPVYWDSIANMLGNYNHFGAKYLLITHKYGRGDTTSARSLLNQLMSDSANNNEIMGICNIWKWRLDARGHNFDSTWIENNISGIKTMADNPSVARAMAQSIVTNFYSYEDSTNGFYMYQYPADTMLANLIDSAYEDSVAQAPTLTIACAPNPFSNTLGITIENLDCQNKTITLLISDLNGNIVYNEETTIDSATNCGTSYKQNGALNRSIDASAWYTGYYFAVVKQNGVTQCYSLILKQ